MSSNNSSLNELIEKGESALNKSDYKKAIEYYEQALEAARDIRDRERESDCLRYLGNAYADLVKARTAIEYYEQALKIARDNGYKREEGSALGNLGNAYKNSGEIKKAIEYYEQALKIARDIRDALMESNVLGNLGLAYCDLGETKKSIEYYEQALKIARDKGYKLGEGVWISAIGEVNLILGEWDSSLKSLYDSLSLFECIENPMRQATVLALIGDLQIKSGDWENARKNLNKSIEKYKKTAPHMITDALVTMSELNVLEESFVEAYANLEQAYKTASKYERNSKKIPILFTCGRAKIIEYEKCGAKAKENVSIAKKYIESAIERAEKFQMTLEQGISLRELGILYSKDNQKDESFNYFKKSLEIFQKINAKYELARTYFEFARISYEKGGRCTTPKQVWRPHILLPRVF